MGYQDCCAAQAAKRRLPRQVQIIRRRIVAPAACEVAGHIKSRVAGVLCIEHTGARADNPLRAGIPGNAQPRRKVLLVISDQPLAETAITRDLHGRFEPYRKAFIEIPGSLPYESRVTAHICDVRSRIDERHLHVDQISGLI